MKQKQNRSSYKIVGVSDSFLAIVDLDQGRSVTNDANTVVAELIKSFPDREIAYRDTMGTWAWLKHTGTPDSFSGFEPMNSGDAALLVEGIAAEGLKRLNKPGLDAAPREIQEHLAGKVAPNPREVLTALQNLHTVMETARNDEVEHWYRSDPFAVEARDEAIEILTRDFYL